MRLVKEGTKPLRLQEMTDDKARAGVLRRAERLFDGYRRGKEGLPPNRLVEMSYDELVADPVAAAERILAAWGMSPDPTMARRWAEFQKTASPIRPTPTSVLSAADKADVRTAFRYLFDEFGYDP
jgi:hypothetical protein